MEWKSDMKLWTNTILTLGSEFLMAWKSWSRTWATKSTTTTSRKPLRWSSTIFRSKRMHVLLRADQRLKQNHEDVLLLAHPQELFLSEKEIGLILSQKIILQSISQCQNNWVLFFVMVYLLREDDGAIEFWRDKEHLRNDLERYQHCSDQKWKSTLAKGGGGNKKRFQYCTDPSGQEILFLRALRGHSGRNLIDPSHQDNVLILDDFFEYINHIGCAINLHSIMNSGMIREDRIWATDRRLHIYGSRWMRNIKIQMKLTWMHHVLHGTLRKRGKTPRHSALGRHATSARASTLKIKQNMIERRNPLFAVTNHKPGAPQTRSSDDSKSFNDEDKNSTW